MRFLPVTFRTPLSLSLSLSLASEQTLKDLKVPRGTNVEVRRGDLANCPPGLLRNSPQRLNISSMRAFDRIRDPEIPIALYVYVCVCVRACVRVCVCVDVLKYMERKF